MAGVSKIYKWLLAVGLFIGLICLLAITDYVLIIKLLLSVASLFFVAGCFLLIKDNQRRYGRIKELVRKRTRELQASKERLNALSDASFEAIFVFDQGVCIDQNRTAEIMFGYTYVEAVGKPGIEWIAPESRELVKKNVLSGFEEPYKVIVQHKNGTTFPAEIQGRNVEYKGRRVRVIALRDITVRVQAEKILQQRERYLEALNKAGALLLAASEEVPCQEFINVIGPAYHASRAYLFFNHQDNDGRLLMNQVAEWCAEGIKPEIDNPLLQNLPYEKSYSRWHKILSRGDSISSRVVDLPAAERDLLEQQEILCVLIVPLFIDNGFNGFIGFDNCVDDKPWGLEAQKYLSTAANLLSQALKRNKIKEKLEQEYQRFVTVLDSLDAIVYATDMITYEIVFLNKLAKKVFGDKIGKICWQVLQKGQTEPCDFCTNDRLLDNDGKPVCPYVWEFKNTIAGKWYQCRDQAITWTDGRLVRLEIATDITETRRIAEEKNALQEKLLRSRKMEAVGLMASGVAHDLNNILSGIVGYPDLLLMQLPEDSKLCRPIKAIKESGCRAADVIADLLTVARGVVAIREIVNLNVLITEYMNSLEFNTTTLLYPNITFISKLEPTLLNISCSPIHIKKCIMNLVINAAEAVSSDGRVIISTENQYVDKAVAQSFYMEKGEYVVVKVSDTGGGISKEDLSRIFEPFYTKKVMGRSGTGLGLAVLWNSVQDHGGGVTVSSNVDGTVFKLYLPATREELNGQIKKLRIDKIMGHGEKILIIDDEILQQNIATGILTELGYQVHSVSSGEEAVAYLKIKSVDLLLLDMIMDSGMGGLETYEQILKLHPGQKAIIASGFSENKDVRKLQKLGVSQFLKKPYTLNQIGLAVQQIFEKNNL